MLVEIALIIIRLLFALTSFFLNFEFFGLLMPKMKNNNYICHALYLRNSIAYDHDFRCTIVER